MAKAEISTFESILAPEWTSAILLIIVLGFYDLGHQFAFLGLVESSSALLVVFGEFALVTFCLTVVFCLGAMWLTRMLERLRTPS